MGIVLNSTPPPPISQYLLRSDIATIFENNSNKVSAASNVFENHQQILNLSNTCKNLENNTSALMAQKNNNITVVANYPYGITAAPTTWYTVINHSLDRGLYLIKQSAKAQNGCSGISLEMNIGALLEQQTDRDPPISQPNTGGCCVRGVIGSNIYYSETPFQYIGKIYVDHATNAYIEGFVTIIKIW